MAIKIYTRTGDKGETGLLGGTRVSKHHVRIESYGTIDELNAHVGLVHGLIGTGEQQAILLAVQDRLFAIGSALACDPEKEPGFALPDLKDDDVLKLEQAIDHMNNELPPLKNFVLPSGHPTVSQVHIARCVCRRAERRCVALFEVMEGGDQRIIIYLNRLSDYLFVLSRYAALQLGVAEINWRPRTG